MHITLTSFCLSPASSHQVDAEHSIGPGDERFGCLGGIAPTLAPVEQSAPAAPVDKALVPGVAQTHLPGLISGLMMFDLGEYHHNREDDMPVAQVPFGLTGSSLLPALTHQDLISLMTPAVG